LTETVDQVSGTGPKPWRPATIRRPVGGMTSVAFLVVLFLSLTATAMAWRHPNPSERRAIAGVASRSAHAGHSKVSVSEIRVSTVGPWASATVTIYFGNSPDSATDILHKAHGKWVNASIGTAGEWCVMPIKDQRNLGFPSSYPCG
jgi:hypothetical protein